MTGEEVNLSGHWTGLFRYPIGAFRPVAFDARLSDLEGLIEGETSEVGGPDADILGSRDGQDLTFQKRYRDEGRLAIRYDGSVSRAGLRVDGSWTIDGPTGWSGTFFMVRLPKVPELAEETREAENVI